VRRPRPRRTDEPPIAHVVLPITKITPEDVGRYAIHAEQLGFDAVFVGDHLAPAAPILESTLTLAAAAVTRQLRVGFGDMILALRHPAWAAKQIATLQQLSRNPVCAWLPPGGPHQTRSAAAPS
jgi:alkanesulfonate monooxygenase SsuD/methylene tetrahydromethanopterin reductase-like flavin-dependent oxidoreductase (luciferase family)